MPSTPKAETMDIGGNRKGVRSPRSVNNLDFQPVEGMAIEIRDEYHVWSPGRVIKVKPPPKASKGKSEVTVVVRYDGWEPKWDERIPWSSPRLARLFTYTRQVKCFVKMFAKQKSKPTLTELENHPVAAPKSYSRIWPCTVQLRMPDPKAPVYVRDVLTAKQQLLLEPKVHIIPYAIHLLPLRLQKLVKGIGGGWYNFSLVVPWTNTPETFGVCQQNFGDAFAIAQADTTIVGLLHDNIMTQGTLLKDEYLERFVGGSGRFDGALVSLIPTEARSGHIPSRNASKRHVHNEEQVTCFARRPATARADATSASDQNVRAKHSRYEENSRNDTDDEPLFKKRKTNQKSIRSQDPLSDSGTSSDEMLLNDRPAERSSAKKDFRQASVPTSTKSPSLSPQKSTSAVLRDSVVGLPHEDYVMNRGTSARDLENKVLAARWSDVAHANRRASISRNRDIPSEITVDSSQYDENNEEKAASLAGRSVTEHVAIPSARDRILSQTNRDDSAPTELKEKEVLATAQIAAVAPATSLRHSKPSPEEKMLRDSLQEQSDADNKGQLKSAKSPWRSLKSAPSRSLKSAPVALNDSRSKRLHNGVETGISHIKQGRRGLHPLTPPTKITEPLFSGVVRCQESPRWLPSMASGGNAEVILGSFPTQTQAKQSIDVAALVPHANCEDDEEAALAMDNAAVSIRHVIEAFERQVPAASNRAGFSMHAWSVQHLQNTLAGNRAMIPIRQGAALADNPNTATSKRKSQPRKIMLASLP